MKKDRQRIVKNHLIRYTYPESSRIIDTISFNGYIEYNMKNKNRRNVFIIPPRNRLAGNIKFASGCGSKRLVND